MHKYEHKTPEFGSTIKDLLIGMDTIKKHDVLRLPNIQFFYKSSYCLDRFDLPNVEFEELNITEMEMKTVKECRVRFKECRVR